MVVLSLPANLWFRSADQSTTHCLPMISENSVTVPAVVRTAEYYRDVLGFHSA